MILINGIWCEDYLPDTSAHTITQFARCGCTNTCSCRVEAGECIDVQGNGSVDAPYIVSLVQGCVEIEKLDTNTVNLEGNGTAATPLTATVILTADNVGPLAGDPLLGDNLLKENTSGTGDGLYVSCEDIQDCVGAAVSLVAGDCLVYTDNGDPGAGSISVVTRPDAVDGASVNPGNGIECTDTGLLVAPSANDGNQIIYGTDGRLFVPAAVDATTVQAQNDPASCVVVAVTENPADTFNVSASVEVDGVTVTCGPTGLVACAPGVIATPGQPVGNADCVQVVVTPGGPDCATPFQIDALLQIDPDQCNALDCRAGGLFVLDDTGNGFAARADRCSSDGPPENDPQPLPGGRTTVINTQTITITNNNACRAMRVVLHVDFPQTIVQTDTGVARVIGMIAEDGGPLADAVSQTVLGAPGIAQFVSMQTSRVQGILIPPLGSVNYSAQLDVDLAGGSPGAFAQGCIALSAIGHLT